MICSLFPAHDGRPQTKQSQHAHDSFAASVWWVDRQRHPAQSENTPKGKRLVPAHSVFTSRASEHPRAAIHGQRRPIPEGTTGAWMNSERAQSDSALLHARVEVAMAEQQCCRAGGRTELTQGQNCSSWCCRSFLYQMGSSVLAVLVCVCIRI